MKVNQVKVHEYLDINLYYSVKGKVNITMLYYINEIMEWLEKAELEASVNKSSAAPLNLFVVDEKCEKLIKEKS